MAAKIDHEALVEMVRHRPAVVADILTTLFNLELPAWTEVREGNIEVTELEPVQHRADAVTVFTDAAGRELLAVITEIQTSMNSRKRQTWPHYLTSVHARKRGCPTILLVICPDRATARWAAAPIEVGHPGWVLRPLVLGPDTTPVVTDPIQARRSPELAVLSALAHGAGPQQEQIFEAMVEALQEVDQEHYELYTEIVLRALPEAARNCLEEMMDLATFEFKSDYWRRKLDEHAAEVAADVRAQTAAEVTAEVTAEVAAETEAGALLDVLAARGIDVPDQARARITQCGDVSQLKAWLRRAAVATTIADVLD